MNTGGYQTIDFSALTNEPVTIKGAFKKAKTGKAILCENFSGMTQFSHDADPTNTTGASLPVTVIISDTPTIVLINITNEDVVSIVVPE